MALLVLALAGCGASGELPRPAAARLQPQVAAIRAAATAGDQATAVAATAQLRQMVTDLRSTDEINDEQASAVLADVDEVQAQLALLAPPPTEPTTTSTVAAERTPPTERDDERPGKGEGKGKKDDGDD